MTPILTIAIPTFNSPVSLLETIQSIHVEPQLRSQVEIIVVDNGSNVENMYLIRSYEAMYPAVKFFYNDLNIGYDRNIDLLFKLAIGKYVKIIADDDLMAENAVNFYLEYLVNHSQLGLIVSNFDVYDQNFKKIVHQMRIVEKDFFSKNLNDFVEKSFGRWGQVSALAINRKYWLDLDLTAGFQTNFIHVLGSLLIAKKYSCLVTPKKLVKIRQGSPNFLRKPTDQVTIPLGGMKIMHHLYRDRDSSRSAIRNLRAESARYVLNAVRDILKSSGKVPLQLIAQVVKSCYFYPPLWYKHLPRIFLRKLRTYFVAHR